MEDIVLNEEDVPGVHFTKNPEDYSMIPLDWMPWFEADWKKPCLIDRVKNGMAAKQNVDPKIDNG